MTSETKESSAPHANTPLPRGTYAPSTASDLRSPCPVVNSLANHGYIPRDGRNIHLDEILGALKEVGVSYGIRSAFSHPIFLEYTDPNPTRPAPSRGIWYLLRNPWALLLARFGMRRPGQTDAAGRRVLDLDQLARHNVVEHDVSLSRRDAAQGDDCTRQPDLVQDLLAASTDGGRMLSMQDLVELRKRRIATQKAENKSLDYGKFQHQLGCGEIALILGAFGDGKKVPVDRVRAVFEEERLPWEEGWKKRWWTLGFVELQSTIGKVKKLIGPI